MMKKYSILCSVLLALAIGCVAVRADVSLPDVIGSSMVLQQKMKVPIWGTAEPGEAVTVAFAGQMKSAVAGGGYAAPTTP